MTTSTLSTAILFCACLAGAAASRAAEPEAPACESTATGDLRLHALEYLGLGHGAALDSLCELAS